MVKDDQYLAVIDASYLENNLWFSSWYSNGIFKLDISRREIEFVDFFQSENFLNRSIQKIHLYKNEIYFWGMYPYRKENYITSILNVESLEQKEYWKLEDEKIFYHDVIQRENDFIAVPADFTKALLVFNAITKESYTVDNWIDKENIAGKSFGKMILVDDYYYAACVRSNQILRLNKKTLKAEMLEKIEFSYALNQLIAGEQKNTFYATGFQENSFLEWKNGKIKAIRLPDDIKEVSRGAVCNGKLYLFSAYELQNIVVYHIETGQITTIPIPTNVAKIQSRNNCPLFGNIKVIKDMVVALPWQADSFLCIDSKTDVVTSISSKIDYELARKCYLQIQNEKGAFLETKQVLLNDWLDEIKTNTSLSLIKKKKSVGETIYDVI